MSSLEPPLYPLPEDEITKIDAILARAHAAFPHCQVKIVYTWTAQAPEISFERMGNAVCEEAREKFNEKFNSECYPTCNLTKWAFDAVDEAAKRGASSCSITTYCCSSNNCPQQQFIECVLEILVGPLKCID